MPLIFKNKIFDKARHKERRSRVSNKLINHKFSENLIMKTKFRPN